jgi:hypothetical protein
MPRISIIVAVDLPQHIMVIYEHALKFPSQQIAIMASDNEYMKIYFAGSIRAGRDEAA